MLTPATAAVVVGGGGGKHHRHVIVGASLTLSRCVLCFVFSVVGVRRLDWFCVGLPATATDRRAFGEHNSARSLMLLLLALNLVVKSQDTFFTISIVNGQSSNNIIQNKISIIMVFSIRSSLLLSSLILLVLPFVSHAWTSSGGIHHRGHRGGSIITAIIPGSRRTSSSSLLKNDCIEGDASTSTPSFTLPDSRRTFLTTAAVAMTMSMTGIVASPQLGIAAVAETRGNDELIDIYFGCGCFWHVQHEFVQAERNILQRSDEELTSRAGYAGGKKSGSSVDGGKVCYHNAQNIADYGKLGHAEVVSLRIPTSKFEEFAKEYCKLFDKDGLRPDQFGDRGSEYRNLVGIPGGKSSPLADILVKASVAAGDKLDFAIGRGDDADMPKVSFIMDTNTFPFYVAENYHQFHDGFRLDENYPDSYNSLARKFAEKGETFGSCPNGMMGLGVGGL